jgi:Flp pilus assembly protein TadG
MPAFARRQAIMVLCFSVAASRRRRGSITPLAVLCLALLLGVVALVVDGGTLMEDRRHVQAAADAAALAAAADLFANYPSNQGKDPSGTANASALSTAAANGFSNNGVQSIVTINISPSKYQGGPHAGKPLPPGYVEVLVQYNADRLFGGIFGSRAIPVRARAVARSQWGPVGNKVLAMNTIAPVGVGVGGSANVNINGGLLVNSNSSSAITVAPSASLTASSISLNGGGGGLLGLVGSLLSGLLGLLGLGGGGGGSPPPTNYGPTVPDPLRSLPPPDPVQLGLSTQSAATLNINGGVKNLYPGVYNGGINITQGATVTLHPNADGTPGIYFLQGGGLNVSGPSSLTMVAGNTAGVMIYNNWQSNSDAINLKGRGSLILAPPSSGVYQGLTIFQKRGTLTSPGPALTILGSGNVNITGTIYVAYSTVTLEGVSGTNLMGGQVIADTVDSSGNGTVNVDPSGQPTANTRTFGLVE